MAISVAITAKRPAFPQIFYAVLGSSWWSEVFWSLFVPFTHFHVRVLHQMNIKEGQTIEDFSQDVQKVMASTLNIQPTGFTVQDKIELEKQLEREAAEATIRAEQISQPKSATQNGTPSTSTSGTNHSPGRETRLVKMAQQVKEVLPQVPLESIKKDLRKTHCVDTTITNILEGKVPYTPEMPQQNSSLSLKSNSPSPAKASTAASKFSRSSEERHQSFEERKKSMLEGARRRYIEKHGL